MARRRFAVALIIPHPVCAEIDVLRRALGDRQLGRIDPHITIIPPINLRDDEIVDAMHVVERAARRCSAFDVVLGPVTTFGESSPVRFLAVSPWEPVVEVYRAAWTGPFDREERREFHPHVTIDIDGSPTGAPDPAVDLLAGYRATAHIAEITLLEHRHERSDGSGRGWEAYVAHPLRR